MNINQIIAVIRDHIYVDSSVSKCVRAEIEFNQLNNMKNYAFMFKKTERYWSDANWRIVAKDVQHALKHYYSK